MIDEFGREVSYSVEYAVRGEWRRRECEFTQLRDTERELLALPDVSATVCIAYWVDEDCSIGEQQRRITQGELDALKELVYPMMWYPIEIPGRGDIVGVRDTAEGREFLCHNLALCATYYVATEREQGRAL